MTNFTQRWHEVRQTKNSTVVAGLDPAVYEMGRGDKGLPQGADKLQWCLQYIEAVAPYVAAIKPNLGYFQSAEMFNILQEVGKLVKERGLLYICDAKVSDIGSTNDAWVFFIKSLGFDAVTFAPYAGNVGGSIQSAHDRGVAAITMGMMSNPEYQKVMTYTNTDGRSLWRTRVERALEAHVDGLVAGGTFSKNSKEFMEFVDITKDLDVLYLVPGIGHQGGDVQTFFETGINKNRCMISSSRELLFPHGSNSTPEQQAEAAKKLRDTINAA